MFWVPGAFIPDQNVASTSALPSGEDDFAKAHLARRRPHFVEQASPPPWRNRSSSAALVPGAGAALPAELVLSIFEDAAAADAHTCAVLCSLSHASSRHLRARLYHAPVLRQADAMYALRRSLSANPSLGTLVKHLYLNTTRSPAAPSALFPRPPAAACGVATADRILQLCANVGVLTLERAACFDWGPGLYAMRHAREVTLLGVRTAEDFVGLHGRREMRERVEDAVGRNELPGVQRLHLTNFTPSALSGILNLHTLEHLVLTYPLLPPVPPGGMATLRILPRAHMLRLLGDSNGAGAEGGAMGPAPGDRLRRVIVRAPPAVLATIAAELAPIRDERLRFRCLYLPRDGDEAAPPALDLLQEWRLGVQAAEQRDAQRTTDREALLQSVPLHAPWADELSDVVGATDESAELLEQLARADAARLGIEMPLTPQLGAAFW